jgi:hypothetical protein
MRRRIFPEVSDESSEANVGLAIDQKRLSADLLHYGPFHRLESPTQTVSTAVYQQRYGLLVGRPARRGEFSVRAYRGRLPPGARGIEFITDAAPNSSAGKPFEAQWIPGGSGGFQANERWSVPIKVVKNTQALSPELRS